MRISKIKASILLTSMRIHARAMSSNVRSTAASGSQVYDSERAVHEYLLAHYGRTADQMPYSFGPTEALNLSERVAKLCIDTARTTKGSSSRALDVGCAVGAAVFHLTRGFDEVVGVDFSQHFVDAANQMKAAGEMNFRIMKQGEIFQDCVTDLPKDIDRSKATFYKGDACNLDNTLGKFDLVLASNLLCRLPSPARFLETVPDFLNPNGYLVMVSPYSWLEEYTSKSEWIGARVGPDGKPLNSFDEVCRIFKEKHPHMTMLRREDIPFLIREHERKFQYGVSDCVVWQKKG